MTQPLIEHVHELRRRLMWPVLVLLLGAAIGYWWHGPLIEILSRPLGMSLYYSTPGGGFQFVLWVSLLVGMVMALPVLLYQMVRYVEPALNTHQLTRRAVLGTMMVSAALAVAGVVFAYLVILPAALHFFAGFGGEPVKPLISASAYFSFTIGCLGIFALIFQLPLIVLLINKIRRWPPGRLPHYRTHVIIGSFGVGLLLPFTYDPLTQALVAMPIIGLYEVSLVLVWLVNRRAQPAVVDVPTAITAPMEQAVAKQAPRPARMLEPARVVPMRRHIDGRRIVQLG